MARILITIVEDVNIPVDKEDIEIAFCEQDVPTDVEWLEGKTFIAYSARRVDIDRLKADIERLDGNDTCKVKIH